MPFTPSERRNRRYDRVHSIALPNGTQRAMNHILEHLPKDTWISTRDAGLVAYLVGPDRKVAETHGRALTQLHPGGKKARVLRYTPVNPDVIVLTQADGGVRGIRYPPDERLVKRLTSTYTYLGRVRQHFRRHYDLYVRADHPMPPLPEKWVINRRGPDLKPRAARSSAPRPGKARK